MAKVVYDGKVDSYQHLIDQGYNFNMKQYLNRGWELFKAYPWGFVGFFFVSVLMLVISAAIPMASILIQGPLAVGYYFVAKKIANGEAFEFGDFFKGFDHFLHLLLASLIMGILMVIGLIFLLIPGIYLAVAYQFALLFIVFGKIEFWDSMELSRKVITKNWWKFFGMGIVVGLIALFGTVLTLGLGLFVLAPWASLVTYAAFEDIAIHKDAMFEKIDGIGKKGEEVEDISREFLPPEYTS
jgi:hypothetical protein